MSYQLELLTRLVTGDLSPTSFNITEQTTHRDFLHRRFGAYIRHFKIRYAEAPVGELIYQHHDEYAFLELDELPRLPAGPLSTAPRTLGVLLADALPRFQLTLPQMQDANCYQAGSQFFLEITTACSFDKLLPSKARYFYYHTQLLDEAARLRSIVPECVLQQPDTAAVARFIQHHQRTLQNLLTHAHAQLEPAHRAGCYGSPQAYSLADVQKLLYTGLEKQLAYFEHSFPDHLNITAPLSYRRRVQALTDVQIPLSAVLQALQSAEAIPNRLRVMIQECLNRLLITVHDSNLSYQDLLYPRLLLTELHGRLQRGWALTVQNLTYLLLRFNFNSLAFFGLVTSHLRSEAETAGPQPADRYPVILFHLKLYRQLQPATEIRYVPELAPIRTQLINWLKEERDYIDRLLPNITPPSAPVISAPRILTPLSVAQMAQLLRTLYDAGVFGEANQRDLFRLLATNFRTARQEQISEKSLADKYYNVEESTRQAVEKVVKKMLENLRQPHSNGVN